MMTVSGSQREPLLTRRRLEPQASQPETAAPPPLLLCRQPPILPLPSPLIKPPNRSSQSGRELAMAYLASTRHQLLPQPGRLLVTPKYALRLSVDEASRAGATMPLPYKAHPLYLARKITIIVAAIGFVLCLPGLGSWWAQGVFGFCAFCLFVSGIFAAADLSCYAVKKAQHPDEDPKWPLRKWMVGDVILAVLLFGAFVATTSVTNDYYYRQGVIGAYAALCAGICCVLHIYCFYKQLVARYKQVWLAELSQQPCGRCGWTEPPPAPPQQAARPPRAQHPPNTFIYAGPSATTASDAQHEGLHDPARNILTPTDDRDSAMEEGLLIGSDFGMGYGSISTPAHESEPTLEQPEEIVVVSSSSKGKQRASSQAGGSKKAGRKS